jgi:putative phosphoribosyl transferase
MSLRHVRGPPAGLPGTLWWPHPCRGLVVFVHGSGSGRFDARSTALAEALSQQRLAVLLLDLLTLQEERCRWNLFDTELIANRLSGVIRWIGGQPDLAALPLGVFAVGTAAAAALTVATRGLVQAVVTYAGRPILARERMDELRVPTMLLVPESQGHLATQNQFAYRRLAGPKAIRIIPWAGLPGNGADRAAGIADLAGSWFACHLRRCPQAPATVGGGPGQSVSSKPDPQRNGRTSRLPRDQRRLWEAQRQEVDP